MPSTETIVSRFSSQLLAKTISAVGGGLLIIFLARALDATQYGLFFLALSIISVGAFFAKSGIANAAARYLAEYKESDETQLVAIVRVSSVVLLITTGIVALSFFLFNTSLAVLIGEPTLTPLLLFGSIYLVATAFNDYVTTLFQGLERIHIAAGLEVIFMSVKIVAVVGFVIIGFDALGALWGYTIGNAAGAFVGTTLLIRYFYRSGVSGGPLEAGLRRRIIEYSVPITATKAGSMLDKQIDTVLVGFFLGPLYVSFYVIGKQVVEFVQMPANALGYTLAPSYGAAKAGDRIPHASRVYEHAIVATCAFYLPAAVGLLLVAEPMVDYIFGPDYSGAVIVIQLFTIYVVLQAVMTNTSSSLDYLGRARARAIAKGVTSVANVLLNILLIPFLGVIGAVIATLLTYSTYTAANLYVVYTELDLDIRHVARKLATVASIATAMGLIVYILTGWITGLLSLVGVIMVGGIVWAVLVLLSGLLDWEMISSIPK